MEFMEKKIKKSELVIGFDDSEERGEI